jgi:hypothetical protein
MAVSVHHTWPYGVYHTKEQDKEINDKLKAMIKAGKVVNTEVIVDESKGPSPIWTFIDQAPADEYVTFMSQFNPATTDVATV